jgi:hypothetical protein
MKVSSSEGSFLDPPDGLDDLFPEFDRRYVWNIDDDVVVRCDGVTLMRTLLG